MSVAKVTRCTACHEELTRAETAGVDCCPSCGTTDPAMTIAAGVEIEINWHDLLVLDVWASNYAARHANGVTPQARRRVLHSILTQQERVAARSLTLAGEIAILSEAAALGDLMEGGCE